MAFNVKHRPKEFSEFFGNVPTIKSLDGVLKSRDKPHAFFFSGPSGCGKTTLARIIVNKLGCNLNDLHEINMGNNRGIDTAREIINGVYFMPLYGDVKVYLLDECHKSTLDFQNALLKIVEEPPAHVYFIFCTTEPDKVIETIKNRCACYSVSKLSPKRIKKLITSVCEKENIDLDEDQIKEIAKISLGLPRQAVLILEQIKDLPSEDIIEAIQSYTEKDKTDIKRLCRALLEKKNWKIISKIISGLDVEPETIRRAVLGYMSAVLLNKNEIQAVVVIENFADNFYSSGKAGLVLACYESIT